MGRERISGRRTRTEYHGSDNPQYMASAFTSDCIMAFIEDRGVARGQRKLEKGDDLYG